MKRPLTLTGAILGLCGSIIGSIVFFCVTMNLTTTANYVGSLQSVTGSIVLSAIMTAIFIIASISCGMVIPTWKKEKDAFAKKKGLIITSIVFLFIAAVGVVSIVAAVLLIVDLAKENDRVKTHVSGETVQTTSVSIDNKVQTADEFSQKMAKLTELKNSGVLTEEEFAEIKKSYIKDFVK